MEWNDVTAPEDSSTPPVTCVILTQPRPPACFASGDGRHCTRDYIPTPLPGLMRSDSTPSPRVCSAPKAGHRRTRGNTPAPPAGGLGTSQNRSQATTPSIATRLYATVTLAKCIPLDNRSTTCLADMMPHQRILTAEFNAYYVDPRTLPRVRTRKMLKDVLQRLPLRDCDTFFRERRRTQFRLALDTNTRFYLDDYVRKAIGVHRNDVGLAHRHPNITFDDPVALRREVTRRDRFTFPAHSLSRVGIAAQNRSQSS